MKKIFLFAVSALMLFCSCERLFESPKDKLDRLVAAHWDAWKAEGKDTTMCIVDIAKVVPIEWDTVVYVMYDRFFDYKNDDVVNYMNNRYWVENEKYRGCGEESLHFWKNGKLVYRISLSLLPEYNTYTIVSHSIGITLAMSTIHIVVSLPSAFQASQ